jgi:hypothetical protein
MTAAKVNLKEGKKCRWFILGHILFFFSYVAILFARVINVRPDIVVLLREVGLFWGFNCLFHGLQGS